ncbi:ras guanine nucleotide exchange factor domain-containing protein [Cytidiella melzeri]|nr:ras guanine nucleotide exchange factor domain-containing protein [Cytidiella melzeri]
MLLATVSEFVRMLTDEYETVDLDNLALLDAFFLFFREFVTPKDLFLILRARFDEQPPLCLEMIQLSNWIRYQTIVKLHVVRMISTWLDRYYLAAPDFAILKSISRFADTVASDRNLPQHAAILLQTHLRTCLNGEKGQQHNVVLQQIIDLGTSNAQEYRPTKFEPFIPVLQQASERSRSLADILIFHNKGGAEELARGLTVIESQIFHRCTPLDLVGYVEGQSHPVFEKMQRWSAAVNLFVSQCILERRDTEARAQAFELFVEVAVLCKTIRNYSSALSLMLGLQTSRISRLREMMSLVSERHLAMLAGLGGFFNFRGSAQWQNYRDDLRSQHSPAVPLLVVVQADVIKIKAAREVVRNKYIPKSHNTPTGKLIDIHMYRKLRNVVRELESCYAPYKLRVPDNSFVTRWLYMSIRPFEDKDYETYDRKYHEESKKIEPPPPAIDRRSWVQDELWALGYWD